MGTSSWGTSPRLRDIADRKAFDREQRANPGVNEIADHFLAEHKRRETERKAREQAELTAQRKWRAENEAEGRRRLQERLLAVMYDSNAATPKEITRVTQMIQATCPESFGNPEVHWMKLMELRSLIGEEK